MVGVESRSTTKEGSTTKNADPAGLRMFLRPWIIPARGRVIPEVSPRFHQPDSKLESVRASGSLEIPLRRGRQVSSWRLSN
jgi:hypothetical protein